MQIADGNSDSTYFYQIGGTRLKGDFTEIIKQSNDAKIGVRLGGGYQALSNVSLGVDYLAYMHKNGISHYGIVDLGLGFSETMYFNIGFGYQVGLKLKQVMEFQPFVKFAIDMDLKTMDLVGDDYKNQCTAGYIDPGVRIVFNCGYPFQLFVQGSYAIPVYYGAYYNAAPGHGDSWSSQYNIGAGFKINF